MYRFILAQNRVESSFPNFSKYFILKTLFSLSFQIAKVNIEATDEFDRLKKYQIVNDYYGAINVLENLVDKFKYGKDKWQKIKADVLFEIPVGTNESQKYEIVNNEHEPDKCFEMVDDLIQTLEKKENKWSKLKFNIQSNCIDMMTNEEVVTYEIKRVDECKLKILDTIVRNLKTSGDKWDECNIKCLSEINEKLDLVFSASSNYAENLTLLENKLKDAKWRQVNVLLEKKTNSAGARGLEKSLELKISQNSEDLKRLGNIIDVLRLKSTKPSSIDVFESAWISSTAKMVDNIKNQDAQQSVESLEIFFSRLKDDCIDHLDDQIILSVHILGLFLFKLKHINRILASLHEKNKKEAKLVQINSKPPKPPLTTHRISTTTTYDYTKPKTRIYELLVNEQQQPQEIKLNSLPIKYTELNSSSSSSTINTFYDHPFVQRPSANELILNTGLDNKDYVQIHPLLNEKTKIEKSSSTVTSRYACEFIFQIWLNFLFFQKHFQ
jgi:hypothetical protein